MPRLLVLSCCFAFLYALPVLGQSRPNILWISCEDISPHLGCYGDSDARTPIVDQLAAEGVRYSHAFTTAGVCAPCRSGIISGMYQTTLGTHHMRCRAELPEGMRLFPEYLRKAGYYCTNNSKTDYQLQSTPKTTWDQSSSKAHWRNRPDKSQPFFAVFNYTGCHESGVASKEKYLRVIKDLPKQHRHDPAKLTLPPYYPDTPKVREDWRRYYDVISAMDANTGKILQQLKDDGLQDDTIVVFWSDHGAGLPRAKRWLYDSGIHIPLIVRIPPKFRVDGQGVPGTVNDELVSSIDFAPTMLNLAGVQIPAHMQGRAFLGKTLSAPRNYIYGGRDRMDERYDIIRAVRDKRYKYLRNYESFKTYYQYMNTPEKGVTMQEIRRVAAEGNLPKTAALFMAETKPVEELYDTQADPHEVNNLAEDPKLQKVLKRMREAHLDWVADTGDIGLIPEPEIVRREKQFGNRVDILAKADSSLIERIREASSAALDPTQHFETLARALDDSDAAVRYWGAIGLGNAPDAARKLQARITEALADDSPSVQIAAARALLEMGVTEGALETLETALASDQQWVRLAAALTLDEADELARPTVGALKKALQDRQNKYVVRVANRALNELLGTNNRVP